jgi:hypothetical protein
MEARSQSDRAKVETPSAKAPHPSVRHLVCSLVVAHTSIRAARSLSTWLEPKRGCELNRSFTVCSPPQIAGVSRDEEACTLATWQLGNFRWKKRKCHSKKIWQSCVTQLRSFQHWLHWRKVAPNAKSYHHLSLPDGQTSVQHVFLAQERTARYVSFAKTNDQPHVQGLPYRGERDKHPDRSVRDGSLPLAPITFNARKGAVSESG